MCRYLAGRAQRLRRILKDAAALVDAMAAVAAGDCAPPGSAAGRSAAAVAAATQVAGWGCVLRGGRGAWLWPGQGCHRMHLEQLYAGVSPLSLYSHLVDRCTHSLVGPNEKPLVRRGVGVRPGRPQNPYRTDPTEPTEPTAHSPQNPRKRRGPMGAVRPTAPAHPPQHT